VAQIASFSQGSEKVSDYWEKLRVAISSQAGIICNFPPGVLVDFWRVAGRAKELGEF
jgi:hypothetical protein